MSVFTIIGGDPSGLRRHRPQSVRYAGQRGHSRCQKGTHGNEESPPPALRPSPRVQVGLHSAGGLLWSVHGMCQCPLAAASGSASHHADAACCMVVLRWLIVFHDPP